MSWCSCGQPRSSIRYGFAQHRSEPWHRTARHRSRLGGLAILPTAAGLDWSCSILCRVSAATGDDGRPGCRAEREAAVSRIRRRRGRLATGRRSVSRVHRFVPSDELSRSIRRVTISGQIYRWEILWTRVGSAKAGALRSTAPFTLRSSTRTTWQRGSQRAQAALPVQDGGRVHSS